MRNAAIAEWILSLTMAPDRASAAVGDLLEEGASRGVLWFWSNALRTASSHVWRDLRAAPLRMLVLAFAGALTHIVFCLLFEFSLNRAWKGITDSLGWWHSSGVYTFGIYLLTVLKFTGSGFLAGWLAAQRSKGAGLSAALAAMVLIAVLWAEEIYRVLRHPAPGFGLGVFAAMELCVLAGAILSQRRMLTVSVASHR